MDNPPENLHPDESEPLIQDPAQERRHVCELIRSHSSLPGDHHLEAIAVFLRHPDQQIRLYSLKAIATHSSWRKVILLRRVFEASDNTLSEAARQVLLRFGHDRLQNVVRHLGGAKRESERNEAEHLRRVVRRLFLDVPELSTRKKIAPLKLPRIQISLLRWPTKIVRILIAPLIHFPRLSAVTALLLVIGCGILHPPLLTGTGQFSAVESDTTIAIREQLRIRGWTPSENAPVLTRNFWMEIIPGWSRWHGVDVLAIAATTGQSRDLIRFRASLAGIESQILSTPEPVEPTIEADEYQMWLNGPLLAVFSNTGNLSLLTLRDGQFHHQGQFLCQGAELEILPGPAVLPGLISLRLGTGGPVCLANPTNGAVFPGGGNLEYIPATAGNEPFLPWLVERVRCLNFVGPEGIAWLEDVCFETRDKALRFWHGSEEELIAATEPEAAAASIAHPDPPRTTPDAIAPITVTEPSPTEEIQKSVDVTPPAIQIPYGQLQRLRQLSVKVDSSVTQEKPFQEHTTIPEDSSPVIPSLEGWSRDLLSKLKEPTRRVALECSAPLRSWMETVRCLPPAVKPMKGSRNSTISWKPAGNTDPQGVQRLYKTSYRVDPERPFAVLHVLSIDANALDFHLIAGTEEPVSATGLRGRGQVPEEAKDRLALLFNGGFRTKHGAFGFIADGRLYMRPKENLATIAVDRQGQIRMGVWGRDLRREGEYIQLRQNLPPLVDRGVVNRKVRNWGGTVDNATHVWRSGIGITADGRLIYAAGDHLTHATLGDGLVRAGCIFAMQLDINAYHTYCLLFRPERDDRGRFRLNSEKLAQAMGTELDRGISPYTRDFFYAEWKKSSVNLATTETADSN